jgi:hypothetical protein
MRFRVVERARKCREYPRLRFACLCDPGATSAPKKATSQTPVSA